MTKALHRLNPTAQRTIYSKDKSITLFLQDDLQLLIKPKSARYIGLWARANNKAMFYTRP